MHSVWNTSVWSSRLIPQAKSEVLGFTGREQAGLERGPHPWSARGSRKSGSCSTTCSVTVVPVGAGEASIEDRTTTRRTNALLLRLGRQRRPVQLHLGSFRWFGIVEPTPRRVHVRQRPGHQDSSLDRRQQRPPHPFGVDPGHRTDPEDGQTVRQTSHPHPRQCLTASVPACAKGYSSDHRTIRWTEKRT